jgi:dephospho-CoA kinase
MTRIVGLTGGIGSGKSTVAGLFEKLGAVVLDADAIVHELQAPGSPLLGEIAAAFGDRVIRRDGSLDREALAEIVFADEERRQQLNALIHPKVGAEMARRIAEARDRRAPLLVLDVPLLFEAARAGRGTASRVDLDATIVVWVPEQVQIERVLARGGLSREELVRRIGAQMPLDEKKTLADHVIDNSGTLDQTEQQVRTLYEELTGSPS